MINVVTVHWQTPKWVEPQLGYLERNLDEPFRVFAALNGIEDRALWRRFLNTTSGLMTSGLSVATKPELSANGPFSST